MKWKVFLSFLLIAVLLVPALYGCQKKTYQEVDTALILPKATDYPDSKPHDMDNFDFAKPDTITLVMDNKIIGEYAAGSTAYEKILEINTEALQSYVKEQKEIHGEQYSSAMLGDLGSLTETKDGYIRTIIGCIILIYQYADNRYAPVYFQLNNPSQEPSFFVWACQPDCSTHLYPGTQELWDYVHELKAKQ